MQILANVFTFYFDIIIKKRDESLTSTVTIHLYLPRGTSMIMQKKFLFNRLFKKNENISKDKMEILVNKLYSEATINLTFNKVVCPSCNMIGNFEIKGYYERTIIVNNYSVRVKILRIKCKDCGRTHAIFFFDFIPYYQLSSQDSKILLQKSYIDDNYDFELLKKLKKRMEIFKNRIKQFSISINDKIEDITIKYIKERRNSYLQIHRGTIIINQSS